MRLKWIGTEGSRKVAQVSGIYTAPSHRSPMTIQRHKTKTRAACIDSGLVSQVWWLGILVSHSSLFKRRSAELEALGEPVIDRLR